MNELAQKENVRSLAALLGVAEGQAADLLEGCVLVTFDPRDCAATECAKHVSVLLNRTISGVHLSVKDCTSAVTVEVVVGNVMPRSNGQLVFVALGNEKAAVSSQPCALGGGTIHPIGILLAACYVSAATLKAVVGELLPVHVPDVIQLNLAELLGEDLSLLYEPTAFGEACLAGGGAVGNGFIYGLSQFDVAGELHVADDDKVSGGNLQRCALFDEEHVGDPKAKVLCTVAKTVLPKVNAVPHLVRVQDLPMRRSGPWLKRVVVGIDSPRARRSLQFEMPGEVFDASTTGINEIVMHFHQQPTDGACLACVYPHNEQENAHEAHVADVLGVSLADVRHERISAATAELICRRYPSLVPTQLVGGAYDTLFKQLCSTAKLRTSEDRRVLAPFAFVSVLTGAFLAVEFVRRIRRGHEGIFNEWRVSPWSNPVLRRRRILARNPGCGFCSDPLLAALAGEIWKR